MTDDHMASAGLAVNPGLLHETIEGEVMVIDLTTGSYYSLRASAADVWELIEQSPGATREAVVAALASKHKAAFTEVDASVSGFVDRLLQEGLLVASAQASSTPVLLHSGANGVSAQAFDPPVLEKYTDMQDLVLLDPVHEVDQTGWPRRPSASPDDSSA